MNDGTARNGMNISHVWRIIMSQY